MEKEPALFCSWPDICDFIEKELKLQRKDLRHLIYPLNYSSKTSNLISRQEQFTDLYDQDWETWSSENILEKIKILPTLQIKRVNEDTDDSDSNEILYADSDTLNILKQLLVLFMTESGYDSRTRTLLLRVSQNLFKINPEAFVKEIENPLLEEIRSNLSASQCEGEGENSLATDDSIPTSPVEWSRKKWIYATAGVLFGAAVCSFTAGLAAPIFLPAILSAAGMTGFAFLSGSSGVALMATLFGIAGAGMATYRVSRRFADLKDFNFIPLKDLERNRRLRVCVTVSGWIKSESDFTGPWIESYLKNESVGLAIQSEVYCLAFEKDIMLSLGGAIQDFIKSSAVTIAASEFIKYTVTAAASSALLFPVAVLQAGDLVDNPWTLGLDRARKAGKALAEALRRGAQGRRPVTLIGYSLGALVIFTCLQELARTALNENSSILNNMSMEDLTATCDSSLRSDSSSLCSMSASSEVSPMHRKSSLFGIVENVVLMGLPTHLPAPSVWNQLRLLVSGRFVHCYSKSDWVLKFLYRTSSPTASDIAGLGPIADAPTIENLDVSEIVLGHADYQVKTAEILRIVDL